MNVTNGNMGRTTSGPISALRLIVDKDQGHGSGILVCAVWLEEKKSAGTLDY